MSENSKHHQKSDIYIFLKKSFFAVLSFNSKDENGNNIIKTELMIFNTTESGDFYLTLKKPSSYFSGINKNNDVTLLIYKEEEDLENIARVVINGKARIIENLNSDEAERGFKIIGEKSPLIKHLMYEEDGEKDDYCLIYMKSETINYVSMSEIINKIEPTILMRK
jgi:general stress protein 26